MQNECYNWFQCTLAWASSLLSKDGYSVMEGFQWSWGAINPACCVYHYHWACVQFLSLLLWGDILWIISQPSLLCEGGWHFDKYGVKRDSCMFQEVYYERFKYQEDKCNSSVWMIMIIITIILQFVQYTIDTQKPLF